ncbi:AraC family transcriptional regulator [Paenibacillus nasutitermitis]|uniref:AraC family transcriptional regulator n=1 Tax=Paenibacillus nasutitermitis TaxID=1652958 RepID=A0A916YLW5_9BACL|nr:AraC family transcriptional regulator [Paenibacillus nasutitermitis]GGD51655.1 AraC family transcriptional regulator [Paenibacillus nasutitermitis]
MTVYTGNDYFRDSRFPFYIDRAVISRNQPIPSHTHDFVELVFVVEGSAFHEMAGHQYRLATGDVFILEPHVYHSYLGSADEDTVVYNVLFDTAFLQKELEALQEIPAFIDFFYLMPFLRKSQSFIPYHPLQAAQKLQFQSHLQTIYDEYEQGRDGSQLIIKTRWIECLVWLSRYHQENRSAQRHVLSDRERILSIRNFVELNYKQPLTLIQLSRICGMSVSSFTAKFKENTGKSLMDYKHEVQIRHASALLLDTDTKILDVALETGFNDISFFNKTFRKHTGMTPREYRRSHKTEN